MFSGIVLLWFVLTALSVAFVATDIHSTPESPVLKWGFALLVAYTGPIGAFLYVLGCREPLPGLHSQYVSVRWRQVLGSTMHCVAGDGAGILAGAVLGSVLRLRAPAHIALEYVLGFGFGWTVFQALFMRDMAGGSLRRALQMTFIPEFLSMNVLMAGMLPIMNVMMSHIAGTHAPQTPGFWFVLSMALLAGAVVAYPMNWWLVARHMKHGMMTVRRPEGTIEADQHPMPAGNHMKMSEAPARKPSAATVSAMALLSIALFAAGVSLSLGLLR